MEAECTRLGIADAFHLDFVKIFTMMEAMFARIGKMFLVFALAAMLGANWAFLQTVAWTGMLANNLRTQGLNEAISRTFDGEHPCPLCEAIAAGKKTESKDPVAGQTQKLEFPPLAGTIVFYAPPLPPCLPAADSFVKFFRPKPLLPPPRGFFV